MAAKTRYVCNECGYESAKWMGRCPDCGNWNTMEESTPVLSQSAGKKNTPAVKFDSGRITLMREIPLLSDKRTMTDMEELNRVLGGGIVKGSAVLAGGEPGIGKSTLFLQMADSIAKVGKVLYVSAEESGEQVRMRAERLKVESPVLFLAETELKQVLAAVEAAKPEFLVVDSIQTIYSEELSSAPGSVSQVKECASKLVRLAKEAGISVFIIGHVTKEGALAGPRVLEHIVDTVLYFEGERNSSLRILRAVKNRFGSTNEIGVFEMSDEGMREVPNPSEAMLSDRQKDVAGACIFSAVEGTRPLLLEVEALVSDTAFGTPRRMATGVDYNRVSLVTAVLEKKIGLKLYNQDIYVNVGGGIRLFEPAADMAVAASIVSSFRNKPIRKGTVIFGEIGLTGELRHVAMAGERVREAERLGMERIILPRACIRNIRTDIELIGARSISDALAAMF